MKHLNTLAIALMSRLQARPGTHVWALKELFEHSAVPFASYSIFVTTTISIHHLIELLAGVPYPYMLLCFVEKVVFTLGTIVFLAYMVLCTCRALSHIYDGFCELGSKLRIGKIPTRTHPDVTRVSQPHAKEPPPRSPSGDDCFKSTPLVHDLSGSRLWVAGLKSSTDADDS